MRNLNNTGRVSPITILVGVVIGVSILSYILLLSPNAEVKPSTSETQHTQVVDETKTKASETKATQSTTETSEHEDIDDEDYEFDCVLCEQECGTQTTCPPQKCEET
jgi:cytoskeletal protein RodZ